MQETSHAAFRVALPAALFFLFSFLPLTIHAAETGDSSFASRLFDLFRSPAPSAENIRPDIAIPKNPYSNDPFFVDPRSRNLEQMPLRTIEEISPPEPSGGRGVIGWLKDLFTFGNKSNPQSDAGLDSGLPDRINPLARTPEEKAQILLFNRKPLNWTTGSKWDIVQSRPGFYGQLGSPQRKINLESDSAVAPSVEDAAKYCFDRNGGDAELANSCISEYEKRFGGGNSEEDQSLLPAGYVILDTSAERERLDAVTQQGLQLDSFSRTSRGDQDWYSNPDYAPNLDINAELLLQYAPYVYPSIEYQTFGDGSIVLSTVDDGSSGGPVYDPSQVEQENPAGVIVTPLLNRPPIVANPIDSVVNSDAFVPDTVLESEGPPAWIGTVKIYDEGSDSMIQIVPTGAERWWNYDNTNASDDTSAAPGRPYSVAVPFSGELFNQSLTAGAFGAFLLKEK